MRQKFHLTPQALLCGVLLCLFLTASCENPPATPTWEGQQIDPPEKQLVSTQKASAPPDAPPVCFMVYNLKNYLSMPRKIKGVETIQQKPEQEISDLVNNIQQVDPDILGICEIGTEADLSDLQSRLKAKGIDLPFRHLSGGADAYRRLAILSKIPLDLQNTPKIEYYYQGKRHLMLRGILDVGIELPSGYTRFIGVHLKSKRPSQYYDQALVRRNEAELVREHADHVMQTHSRIIVYGDFNDTTQSPSIRAIAGDHSKPNYLYPLPLQDNDGQRWTHYWKYQDIYSRFDYAFVSPSLRKQTKLQTSYILETNQQNTASDHRPLVITLH